MVAFFKISFSISLSIEKVLQPEYTVAKVCKDLQGRRRDKSHFFGRPCQVEVLSVCCAQTANGKKGPANVANTSAKGHQGIQ